MNDFKNAAHPNHRGLLLASASVLSLLASACLLQKADAADGGTDNPTIWLELGYHLERYDGRGDVFAPPFTTSAPRPDFETTPLFDAQNRPLYSYGADGKISFQPHGSEWLFSASIQYGRVSGRRHAHQETSPVTAFPCRIGTYYHLTCHRTKPRVADSNASVAESHAIIDFQAGKDFGLGMFGRGSTSTLSFGVRFAQLQSKSTAGIDEVPDYYLPTNIKYYGHHTRNKAAAYADRSFRGVGPSISWDASAPMVGDMENGEVTLDWGINTALLFGRQKVKLHHQTTSVYYQIDVLGPLQSKPKYLSAPTYNVRNPMRSKSLIVPNLGGFAGVSVRYSDVKLRVGYRADFFLGAIDGGWDTRQSTTRGFYGPFANISVGIGG